MCGLLRRIPSPLAPGAGSVSPVAPFVMSNSGAMGSYASLLCPSALLRLRLYSQVLTSDNRTLVPFSSTSFSAMTAARDVPATSLSFPSVAISATFLRAGMNYLDQPMPRQALGESRQPGCRGCNEHASKCGGLAPDVSFTFGCCGALEPQFLSPEQGDALDGTLPIRALVVAVETGDSSSFVWAG